MVFTNLMYPDNNNRASRAAQLGQDCGDFAAQCAGDKEKVDLAINLANEMIKRAYQSLAQKDVGFTPVTIDTSWVVNVTALISPLIVGKLAMNGLQWAAKSWLLSQGRIGEAAFADLVGLPRWLGVGKLMGGFAAILAVQAIIDAIDGAAQRDKLQEAIHQLIKPRIDLKKRAMINSQVLISLQAVTTAYEAITGIPDVVFSKEQLDTIARNLIDKHEVSLNSFTDEKVKDELAKYDRQRNAWTTEDH